MSAIDPRTPCVVGVARSTVRPGEGPPTEPLELWARVCRAAADDSGASNVLERADSLQVVYCQSWPYDDPPGRLAETLGISPAHRFYSGIGGTVPQVLAQSAAEEIIAGRMECAVLVAGEALDTVRRTKKAGERLPWSHRDPEKKPFPFEAPFHPAEIAHNVFQAWLTFPIFDIARRAKLGISPEDYRRQIGETLAPFSEVAATSPHAWFPVARSVDELVNATPENRMVAYPYTKYEVSVMDVDMAAAVIVCSHAHADALGVPIEKRVYLRGWAYAEDPVYVAEHVDMASSPAMAHASKAALGSAEVTIDDVAYLDLYSCFASSVHFACDALGIRPDDPRGLTVTGGLPYSGGAGSGYVMHSIAAMVEKLRSDPGAVGLVSGVGMHMTKHAFGLYSTTPGRIGDSRSATFHPKLAPIVDRYEGAAEVAAYTVAHARSGEPEWGLVIADVEGGRAYGKVEDPQLLADLEAQEWVGQTVSFVPGEADGVNLVKA